AFPLLFMPSFITQSLSTALVPAIGEAAANKNGLLIHERMNQALGLGLLIGAPATVILFEWATPLTTLVYNAPEAGLLLKILAPMFFLHYFDAPLHAILLGLGRANATLWNFVVATVFKAVSIFVFGSQFGIIGVTYGIGIGIIMQTLLNFLSISSSIGFYWSIQPYIKAGLSMVLMALCGRWTFDYLTLQELPLLWSVIGSIAASLLLYFAALLLMDTLKWKYTRGTISIPR
ncbi:polysaccharide biosynthesis C-terminal domain-containing protein, partial [Paenibacillus sepulcri]|nr:polysaccharide biosynthesis C-terminal domain-containing protein [Paenibacillus sepulcri]